MSCQRLGGVFAVILTLGVSLSGQVVPRSAFEVASVRLVEKPTPSKRTITDTRVDLVSYPIQELILMAYNVERYRLVLPDWVIGAGIWVEIHATLPAGGTAKQLPEMLRTLLAERFGMVAHVEPRPMDVYELTIASGGIKMREVEPFDDRKTVYPVMKGGPDSPFDSIVGSDNQTRMIMSPDGGLRSITADSNYERKSTQHGTTKYDATRVRMPLLVEIVSSSVGRPVIDKTGLTGLYQFQIELPLNPNIGLTVARAMERSGITTTRTGDPINVNALNTEPASGSAFKAVESLGLKLEARRLPFDVLVVDKLEKAPTAN